MFFTLFWIFCCHSFVFHIILALLRQVGDLETDRSYYYNCIRPGCPSAVQFFFLASYVSWYATHKISPSSDENCLFENRYKKSYRSSSGEYRLDIGHSAHFSLEDKGVAIELWKAKVTLKSIRAQLNMSEATLRQSCGDYRAVHPEGG